MQELSRIILTNLGQGEGSADALQSSLVALLRNPHPHVQRTGAQTIRQLLVPHRAGRPAPLPADAADLSAAICGMFSTLHAHIMYESLELAAGALSRPSTRSSMLRLLAALLRPGPYPPPPPGGPWRGEITLPAAVDPDDAPPPALASQAAAARLVVSYLQPACGGDVGVGDDGVDAATCAAVAEGMAEAGVADGLLVALANTDYLESKKQARCDLYR